MSLRGRGQASWLTLDWRGSTRQQGGWGMKHRIALEVSRTLALYGFAGWVYIALVALVHPQTLVLQLTHFTKLPHEDTFGETCFVVSAISFFVYNMLRSAERKGDS
jgi:hypothetical protein